LTYSGVTTPQSELAFLISRALVLWDARVRAGYTLVSEIRRLQYRFADDLYARFGPEVGRLSQTNIDWAFNWFLEEHPDLLDWYHSLIDPDEELVDWKGNETQPRINFRNLNSWERLCNHFDPDSLLTLDLARKRKNGPSPVISTEFTDWTTVVRIKNQFFDTLKPEQMAFSDLHIHVSGIRLPQAAWRELLLNEVHLKIFKDLNRIYDTRGRKLKDDIEKARRAYRALQSRVGGSSLASTTLRPVGQQWWRWSYQALTEERQLLANAWRVLLVEPPDHDFLRELDLYLSIKHRFFETVRQAAFPTEPGLRHFELDYFSALKRVVPREKWRRSIRAAESSPRLAMSSFGDACQFLLESKVLKRIELRISPLEHANAYIRFFKSWHTLKQQIDNDLKSKGRNMPDIRFAVHFRRSLKRRKQSAADIDHVPDEAVKLRALDRATAALRIALNSTGKHQEWMGALRRVDVAGQERDSPALLFALHLRMLRGDRKAIEFLQQLDAEDPRAPWFRRWIELRRRNLHRPRPDREKGRRLGLTVHAGEDFENLLDGLYQVGIALDAFGLKQGDSIGHGLALATLPEDSWLTSNKFAIMPVGQVLDSLCWLKHLSREMYTSFMHIHDPGIFNSEIAQLGRLIREIATLVYRDTPFRDCPASISDHVNVWLNSVKPVVPVGLSRLAGQMFSYRWGEKGMMARGRILPLEIDLSRIQHLLLQAQQMLLHEIIKREVVLELNPSSNVRITGVDAVRQVPTIRLFRMVGGKLLACINTDNPSVFTTRIENEYSLVYQGAIDLGMEPAEIEGLLAKVRDIGMTKAIMR
jgi:hypothetical protein